MCAFSFIYVLFPRFFKCLFRYWCNLSVASFVLPNFGRFLKESPCMLKLRENNLLGLRRTASQGQEGDGRLVRYGMSFSIVDTIIWRTIKPAYPWDPKKWPLFTGGRCSGVIFVVKLQYGTSKWSSWKAGGRYSEVGPGVVCSSLTVLPYC